MQDVQQRKAALEEEAGVLHDQVDAAKLQIESVASKIQDMTQGSVDNSNTIEDLKAQLASIEAERDQKSEESAEAR